MDIATIARKVLALAPTVVKGVEAICKEAKSADKHALAHDALTLATGIATLAAPAEAELVAAAKVIVSDIIDATVAIYNDAGIFVHKALPDGPAQN